MTNQRLWVLIFQEYGYSFSVGRHWPNCRSRSPYPRRFVRRKTGRAEVRRYSFLRTGRLLPFTSADSADSLHDPIIVVGTTKRPCDLPASRCLNETSTRDIKTGGIPVKNTHHQGSIDRPRRGGDPIGTLYGAYRLAEAWGVRFYLQGDVIPDQRLNTELPQIDLTGKPLFNLRGIQPFHDFPEGPDWWNLDDYKAYLGNCPKWNELFGLHTYPKAA